MAESWESGEDRTSLYLRVGLWTWICKIGICFVYPPLWQHALSHVVLYMVPLISDPDHLTIITPKASKNYKYVLLTLDQPWLTFSVSSCQIANVLLSVSPTSTSNISYEVAIKKSSVTFRRGVGGPVLKTEDVNGLLRCNTFKDFWISWMEDSLRIGRGREPGIPVLLEYREDSLTEPKAVSISASSASGATWRFYKHMGK